MVRRPEGSFLHEGSPGPPQESVNLGHLQGGFTGEARKQGRQAPGQHGFSGAGRADHKDVVAPGDGHFQGALGEGLAFDVGRSERNQRQRVKERNLGQWKNWGFLPGRGRGKKEPHGGLRPPPWRNKAGLGGVGRRHDQPPHPAPAPGPPWPASPGPGAGFRQGQLADEGGPPGPVPGRVCPVAARNATAMGRSNGFPPCAPEPEPGSPSPCAEEGEARIAQGGEARSGS